MEKTRKSVSNWVSVSVIGLAVFSGGALDAQQSLESFFRMTGSGITKVFDPQREVIQGCSAVFYDGRDEVAYGVVISSDGYILSKASEIEKIENLSVRVDEESFAEAEIVSVDSAWDVALVKVAAENLVKAPFAADSKMGQGSWVVVNGATSRTRRRVLAGIISAEAREIPPAGGAVLGVNLKVVDGMLKIAGVSEGSGSDKAGLKKDDVILAVEGNDVSEIGEIKELLKDRKVGSKLKMKIKRDDQILEFEVELSARAAVFEEMDRNDMMSGDFSERRSGFPRVIQHDILANSDTMGGPVVNLEGQVVGMNIARANRAETYAIPVEELRELAGEMLARARK